jgi:hypothetical protein
MSVRLRFVIPAALVIAIPAGGAPRLSDPPAPPALPVGKWRVEFANGVVQTCEVQADGTARVSEPLRTADGRARTDGGHVVVEYADDRAERWTRVGPRWVVEHWYPGARLPTAAPVVGIAERTR